MRQKITAVADLETVQGPLQHYSFRDGFKGSHSYYIFLEGDERRYQIPANFLGCFDRDGFESTVAAGDVLKISFNKRFFVFSISDRSRSFMAAESAIAAYNNGEDLWAGTFFFLFAGAIFIVVLIYNRNLAKKRVAGRRM